MHDGLPPKESLRSGHEVRDLNVALVVAAAVLLAGSGALLGLLLWEVSLQVVPEQREGAASPPVLMPGEPAVHDRIETIPPPRLDTLEQSANQHPEDLRADRQPALNAYGWVEKGRVARIPIDRAMNAVAEMERKKAGAKKRGGK
jgi:hypothetical protein